MSSLYPFGDQIQITVSDAAVHQVYSAFPNNNVGTQSPVVTETLRTVVITDALTLPPISGLSVGNLSALRVIHQGTQPRDVSPAGSDNLVDAKGDTLAPLTMQPNELWDFYNVPGSNRWTAWLGAGSLQRVDEFN